MNVYIPGCFGDETWGSQVWRVLHVAPDELPVWRHLCALFDPHAIYNQLSPGLVPQAPGADTFRRIIRSTCLVCTMSCPDQLAFRRRSARLPPVPTYPTPSASFGIVAACATHRPLVFCARCLRSEPSSLGMVVAPHLAIAPLAANERDPEFVRGLDLRSNSGAGVRAVCGACRGERIRNELVRGLGATMALWMGSGFWDWEWEGKPVGEGWPMPWDGGLRARDATRLMRSEDVAGVVNQYIEYGDWTVREALEEMEERVWMRWWTKSIEMEGLVRATARLQRMEERAAEPLDTDDESDEEDDLLSLSDEFGLREMIFQDWARNRILEGIWLSPHIDMQQYYAAATNSPEMRTLPAGVAPRHPLGLIERAPPTLPRQFTWSVLVRAGDEAPHRQSSPNSRPSQRRYIRTAANFYLCNPPPPNRLVYHLARAWEQALRSVLSPAISNVVSRIVKECEATQKFIQEAQWEEDSDRRNRHWAILRTQCVLARGERDPCKAVARIGPDQLVDFLRGPEAWVEGGGWEDIRIAWDDEIDEVERMREMTRMRSRDRDSMAPSPPASTILSVSAPSPTDTTRTNPDTHNVPSPDLHAHADIHSSSTPSPESVTSPTTPSPEALRSPSTMRTTPSPPPSVDGSKKELMITSESDIEAELRASRLPPPSPLTKKPLHPIPLIPSTSYHLGQQTKTVLEMLWREATGGLWMCRCGICARAMSVQGVPTLFTAQVQTQQPQPEDWPQLEPMQVEEPVEGKGKGVAGRRSRERDETDEGERKRIKCAM